MFNIINKNKPLGFVIFSVCADLTLLSFSGCNLICSYFFASYLCSLSHCGLILA